MFSFTHKVAKRAIANVRTRALIAGAFLGSIATALASTPERSAYNLSMAIVMIAAGSASFVLHALHEQALDARATKPQKAASVRLWVSMLGCGVLAASWVAQYLA